jgi:hypothetical protein
MDAESSEGTREYQLIRLAIGQIEIAVRELKPGPGGIEDLIRREGAWTELHTKIEEAGNGLTKFQYSETKGESDSPTWKSCEALDRRLSKPKITSSERRSRHERTSRPIGHELRTHS